MITTYDFREMTDAQLDALYPYLSEELRREIIEVTFERYAT